MRKAIIIFNLGGPSSLANVRKFLFNLFNDKFIINLPQPFRYLLASLISNLRKKKAQNIYKMIGGKSPILENTTKQQKKLENILNNKVFISMRYTTPRMKEIINELKEYKAEEIILLPLYPQFSTTTTKSSIAEFNKYFSKNKLSKICKVKYICCYSHEESFIEAHKNFILDFINGKNLNINNLRFLFSAHGLPKKIVDKGDPYVKQIEYCSNKIAESLNINNFSICYQSKVGPLEWVGPSTEDEIKRAGEDNMAIVIVPIAFTSDHSETLVELDIEYKELAAHHNVKEYYRVPAFNDSDYYINYLSELCKTIINTNIENQTEFFAGNKKIRICGKDSLECMNKNYI